MPRGKRSRVRKAVVEPEKHKEAEVQSDEQTMEQIRNSPPGARDIQVPRSPTEDPESQHGEKDPDSDDHPVLPSKAHAKSSDSQSGHDDSSQKSKKSSKSPRADPSQTSPATKKNKKPACPSRERRNYRKAMKNDPQIEKDIVEFYKTNPCLWDLRQEGHHNKDTMKKLLEEISKITGVKVNDIVGWWKGIRDSYTRLSQKKSGEERDDLPYKQKWVLDNLAFISEKPVHKRAPIKSLQQLAEENPGDLDAVEREAARERKANVGRKGKAKSLKMSGEAEEDVDILALQQTAKDSVGVLESLKESINKVTVKRDEPSDAATLYGQYLIHEMRQMSKRRFKLFRREVEASLAKYSSSTGSEDDDVTPLPKKPSTVTNTSTFSSSPSMTSSLYSAGSSFCPSGMQQSGGDGWQPQPSRWIPNPPQAASIWHSQDSRYMQQYFQQQRMPSFQMQPVSQQLPHRPHLRHVSHGHLAQGQEDFSKGLVRPLYAFPVTSVTSVTNSPLTQALVSSGIDASPLQDNSTQEINVFDQEGIVMDSSHDGTIRSQSAPALSFTSEALPSSQANM